MPAIPECIRRRRGRTSRSSRPTRRRFGPTSWSRNSVPHPPPAGQRRHGRGLRSGGPRAAGARRAQDDQARTSPRMQRAIARFKREAFLARQVTHPNICRIFDLFRHQPAAAGTVGHVRDDGVAGGGDAGGSAAARTPVGRRGPAPRDADGGRPGRGAPGGRRAPRLQEQQRDAGASAGRGRRALSSPTSAWRVRPEDGASGAARAGRR